MNHKIISSVMGLTPLVAGTAFTLCSSDATLSVTATFNDASSN